MTAADVVSSAPPERPKKKQRRRDYLSAEAVSKVRANLSLLTSAAAGGGDGDPEKKKEKQAILPGQTGAGEDPLDIPVHFALTSEKGFPPPPPPVHSTDPPKHPTRDEFRPSDGLPLIRPEKVFQKDPFLEPKTRPGKRKRRKEEHQGSSPVVIHQQTTGKTKKDDADDGQEEEEKKGDAEMDLEEQKTPTKQEQKQLPWPQQRAAERWKVSHRKRRIPPHHENFILIVQRSFLIISHIF